MKNASAFALLCAFPLVAQITGRLSGKVEDTTGAAIPGASIELFLPGNKAAVYNSQTSAEGYFNFIGLRAGQYDLSVQAPGFQSYLAKHIEIDPGRDLTLATIKMTLGAVAETTNVVVQAVGVQTANQPWTGWLNSPLPLRMRTPPSAGRLARWEAISAWPSQYSVRVQCAAVEESAFMTPVGIGSGNLGLAAAAARCRSTDIMAANNLQVHLAGLSAAIPKAQRARPDIRLRACAMGTVSAGG